MSSFEILPTPHGGKPIKAWTRGVPLEDEARRQLHNVASLPFVHKHVAVMPDVHWGRGATVGSVIPTVGAIIPAAVGVDIDCGMAAVRAGLGELGIIPGSMGAKSFIARGKGNAGSFETCSHGAGRAMSRNAAKKRFTLEDHARATAHVECPRTQT